MWRIGPARSVRVPTAGCFVGVAAGAACGWAGLPRPGSPVPRPPAPLACVGWTARQQCVARLLCECDWRAAHCTASHTPPPPAISWESYGEPQTRSRLQTAAARPLLPRSNTHQLSPHNMSRQVDPAWSPCPAAVPGQAAIWSSVPCVVCCAGSAAAVFVCLPGTGTTLR